MKTYIRILGILIFLMSLFFLGLFIYNAIDASTSKYKLISLSGLLPVYIVIHFIIIHRFGFNLHAEYTSKQKNSILVTSIILFIFLLSILAWQAINVVTLERQEAIDTKEYEELKSRLSQLRTWELQTTAYGYVGELKTKYSDGTLYYQLNVRSKNPFNPNLTGFTINFLDSDGFLIRSIQITEYSVMVDKDKIYGVASNSNTDIFSYEADEVDRIANWKLLVQTN
jgi:hypothetical protein